jgi:hypothetical protein
MDLELFHCLVKVLLHVQNACGIGSDFLMVWNMDVIFIIQTFIQCFQINFELQYAS